MKKAEVNIQHTCFSHCAKHASGLTTFDWRRTWPRSVARNPLFMKAAIIPYKVRLIRRENAFRDNVFRE